MASIGIFFIKLYQHTLSPEHGTLRRRVPTCKFQPTCSEYAVLALEKRGFFVGFLLSLKRILRCHPWQKGGYETI